MMLWIGIAIVVLTVVAIIMKCEARTCLVVAGLLMCTLCGHPLAAIDSFTKMLVSPFLVQIIACAMGFACIVTLTGCDKHFSYFALRYLLCMKGALVPLSVLMIWLFSNAINSPAGLAAAVAPIIIPVLMRAGVHPAMAASTVLLGTWGEWTSVSGSLVAQVASFSGHDVPSVILRVLPGGLAGLVVSCVTLYVTALIMKENSGYVSDSSETAESVLREVREFKVNYLKALMPVLPLIILILGTDQVGLIMHFSVPQAMLICSALTLVVGLTNPFTAMKDFCRGMGDGFASIVSLIAAAAVFTAGMQEMGLISALIDAMKESTHIAKIAASWGTFAIAALSGSGDAATVAFNTSITPHAGEMGLDSDLLGMTAYLGAALGRTMSPVAGVCLICAGIAKVSPIQLSKRVAIPVILSNIVGMIVLQYILG